jgi:hypothetical protein
MSDAEGLPANHFPRIGKMVQIGPAVLHHGDCLEVAHDGIQSDPLTRGHSE